MKKKILIINLGKEYGGAEKMLENLVYYIENDLDISLVVEDQIFKKFNEKFNNVTVIKVAINSLNYSSLFIKLLKLIKQENISIVYTHGTKANLIGVFLRKICKIKYIVTIHSDIFYDYSGFKKYILSFIEKVIVNSADNIITVSNNLNQKISKKYRIDCLTIHNGLRFQHRNLIVKKYRQNNKLNLLFVGRLCAVKNVPFLLEALLELNKRNINFECNIIGEGEERASLQKICSDYRLDDKVNFIGFTNNINQYMQKSDLLLMTSLMEGIPMVIIEAFSNYLPVIASNVGGIGEMILDEYNGFLYESNNLDHLVQILLKCYYKQYDLDIIGKNAYESYNNQWSVEKMSKQYLDIFLN